MNVYRTLGLPVIPVIIHGAVFPTPAPIKGTTYPAEQLPPPGVSSNGGLVAGAVIAAVAVGLVYFTLHAKG